MSWRILVADDDTVQLKLVALRLREAGYEVATASGGEAALATLRSEAFDCLLSDVLMPGLDGFRLCQAVRNDPELSELPVVLASSAYVEAADRALAIEAGADNLVVRDPDIQEILAALRGALAKGRTARRVAPELELELAHGRRAAAQVERQAMLNKKLQDQAKLQSSELVALAEVSSALRREGGIGSGTPFEIVDKALARCASLEPVVSAAAFLTNSEGALELRARRGWKEAPGIETFFGCSGLLAKALERPDRTLLIPSGDVDPELAARIFARSRATSILVIPLWTGASRHGALVLAGTDRIWPKDRLAFAVALSGQVSEQLEQAARQLTTVRMLARLAEFHDKETARHTERMSQLCGKVARRVGLGEAHAELIEIASLMHDIGKVSIPDAILQKPGKLTPGEFEVIQTHTTVGYSLLAGNDDPLLKMGAAIAHNHHERLDGQGYPEGLAGNEIPIEGRIASVADCYDALTSDRVYRPAFSQRTALEILVEERGTKFDPAVLDALVEILIEEDHR